VRVTGNLKPEEKIDLAVLDETAEEVYQSEQREENLKVRREGEGKTGFNISVSS
jgi:hypothetical protein